MSRETCLHLNDKDRAFLDGHFGPAEKLAMEVVVDVGRAFEAERLIPITSAHILGHYGSLHDAGIELLERLAADGGACRVPTTVDPSSVDFARANAFRVSSDYVSRQDRLRRAVERLGVTPSWSCTPYLSMNVPRFGQNIAWAESSAVVYANSVIGARTNRTPFGLDICAAITGRIPYSGLYRKKNRVATILFDVQVQQLSDLDYHTLGAIVGSRSGSAVPAIRGIPTSVTNDQLKTFGAAAASAGSVALFHIMGVTPEARLQGRFSGCESMQRMVVTRDDLQEMERRISTADPAAPVDMVTLGCPLLSVEELRQVFARMRGRQVRKDIHFWIYLSQETYDLAVPMGLIGALEAAGIWFSTGTCATISPVKVWGFSHVMTNSAKCALVVPSEHNVRISYRDIDTCILTATEAI